MLAQGAASEARCTLGGKPWVAEDRNPAASPPKPAQGL